MYYGCDVQNKVKSVLFYNIKVVELKSVGKKIVNIHCVCLHNFNVTNNYLQNKINITIVHS